MKQLIKDVLEDIADSQPNLHSEAARENIATAIISTIRDSDKGWYLNLDTIDGTPKLTPEELEKKRYKEHWTCAICGKDTSGVDYDYIGSETNHLGCELELEMKDDKRLTKDRRKGDRREREKNWLQKKHEDKVFGDDLIVGVANEEKAFGNVQKQVYNEMTSDGLPSGGDAQAVFESYKLAEEIVDNKDKKWIYESPDGGKTVFRRPFGDYDMKNKVEINWETKEPTGRKFTDYPFK